MAQVTPQELGLIPFSPQGMSSRELEFIIAYYLQQLQTQGITGSEDVNLTKIVGQPVSVNNGPSDGGTQRVTISNDSTGQVAADITKIAGTATDVNTGTASAGTLRVTQATDVPVSSIGFVTNPTANFTRPADTTAYALGDLVANNTTAGSVVAMTLTVGRVNDGSVMLRRLKLHKSTVSVTLSSFRVHLFRAAPTCANGDNGAFSTDGVANYLGAFDVTIDRAFTDGAAGYGLPVIGNDMSIKIANGAQTIFALIEARAAYAPGNAEVFTVTLDDLQN